MKDTKLKILAIIVLVAIISGFILTPFARSAEVVDENRTDWLESTLIAHRGLHDNEQGIIENSISAFANTMDKGYIIELDVSLTKDNQLVVFHDKKLKRLFGIDKYLKDTTYEELSKLKFNNSKETVPLFSEVLSFVNGKVPLLIEIKNVGKVGEMESMIYSELENYEGQYAIQSFNPYTLKWFKTNAKDVLRGQLSGNFATSDYDVQNDGAKRMPWIERYVLSNLLLNFESRPNFINYEVENTDTDTLQNLKKLGVPILGWTIDDKAEYQEAKDYFDNFVVNTVDIK